MTRTTHTDVNSVPTITKTPLPNRREFLYYLGGASIALLMAEACGALAWSLSPRIRYGKESGLFLLDLETIPPPQADPVELSEPRCYLINTGDGLLAFDQKCVFERRILLKWVDVNDRFECPGCGSKFRLDGSYIEGPAKSDMDRFVLKVTTPHGVITTSPEGEPVNIEEATAIVLDTTQRIFGEPRPLLDLNQRY